MRMRARSMAFPSLCMCGLRLGFGGRIFRRCCGRWLRPVLASPSKFKTTGEFLRFFVPSLTGMVGFWATVALNIPDFTRYAKSQKAQMWGQVLGLPTTMTFYSFIGVAVTSASVVLFGAPVWGPVDLTGRFNQP